VKIPTLQQVSAGGVVLRKGAQGYQVALISVGPERRWQLPKGTLDNGETPLQAALREVREETGLTARLLGELKTVEYYYHARHQGQPVRYHKFVHFFLMEYVSGDMADHDHEVNEAVWMSLEEAVRLLAFESERGLVEMARQHTETG